eukprot:5921586-Alexandrium_andersonii.AAC.1
MGPAPTATPLSRRASPPYAVMPSPVCAHGHPGVCSWCPLSRGCRVTGSGCAVIMPGGHETP